MAEDGERRSCIEEAALLVAAEPGAAERLRQRHRERDDGYCTGCGPALVRWPCVQLVIAELSEQAHVVGRVTGRGRLRLR